MKILELQSNRILEKFGDSYNLQNDYVILSKFDEVCEVKDILRINEDSFVDCMSFDNSIRINPNKSFDSMVLRSLEYIDDEIREFEAHIYTADNFILTVADDESFIYKFMKNLILNRAKSEKSTRYILYKINQYIIREYIMNGFEFVEMLEFIYKFMKNLILNRAKSEKSTRYILYKINQYIIREYIMNGFEFVEMLEERILDIEDDMMENTNSSHIEEINKIRAIARKVVKNIRPLIYITDNAVSKDVRFLKEVELEEYSSHIEEINKIRAIARKVVKNIRPLIYITDNAVSKDVRFLKEVELEEYNDMQGIDFGIDKLYEFSIATRDLADKI